jgi:hypothetical protein
MCVPIRICDARIRNDVYRLRNVHLNFLIGFDDDVFSMNEIMREQP